MRKTIRVIGKGFSEQQAKVSAYNSLKAQYKNNILIYSMLSCTKVKEPREATMCTTENFPAQAAKKWVTQHTVFAQDPNDQSKWVPIDGFPSKTEAVKKAKELALKYQAMFFIKVEKKLGDGQSDIEAIVKPRNAQEGEWEIELDVETVQ